MERMLDITFCCNEQCNKRKNCLRGQDNTLSHEYISNADFNCDESYEFFIPIKKQIIKRYRVESKSKTNHFRSDCTEEELEYWKAICKYDSIENNGKCYYRAFPVTKNKKVYYAKDNHNMTKDELKLINEKLK